MDDLHRAPGDGDRAPLRKRIEQAVADGRISSVDGDIRLTNVASAQSLTELSLIARDLDQLDAARAAAETPAPAPVTGVAPQVSSSVPAPATSSGRLVPLLILGVVFALVVAGGIALFVYSSGSGKDEIGDQPPVAADRETPSGQAPGEPGSEEPDEPDQPGDSPAPFVRDEAGIKALLTQYRSRFGTIKATELTMYEDYAIVRVPVPGKARDAGWIYRDGQWTEFGGVRATFPGTRIVDLSKLDVAAVLKNMSKAKRSLNVEDATISHVSIDFRDGFDDVPNVRVYASNQFGESGYLATTLGGAVVRSYPYSR